MNLYTGSSAKDFSNTRYKQWEGWERAITQTTQKLRQSDKLQLPNSQNELKVLDLGCGNGRFGTFLKEKFPETIINYTGIDNSSELLKIASEKFKTHSSLSSPLVRGKGEDISPKLEKLNCNFLNIDLEEDSWNLEIGTWNLIVAFGLMHHISTFENRKKLLKKTVDHLSPNGSLIVTFWQFGNNEKFLKSHMIKDFKELKTTGKYSENDYILSFGKEKAERFCHHFTNEELDELYKDLPLKRIDTFLSDGIDNVMNYYNISEKI